MSRPTDDYIDPLEADASMCEACCERPHVVALDWSGALGLALCAPCAHYMTRRGLLNERGVPNYPGRWQWETTLVNGEVPS